MTKRQDVEFGPSSEDAAPEGRIAQPPQQLADAMALLKQEVRERKQVEESLHHTNEELKRRAEINARGDAIRAERAAALDRLMGGPQPWIRPTRGWLMRGR